MRIDLVEAPEEQAHVIENLIAFYIYDLSSVMGWKTPESGRFGGQDDLPQYWRLPLPAEDAVYAWPEGSVGYPFLLRVDDELAGFALVKRLGDTRPPRYEMGGFFVLRRFRRRGVGTEIAHRLFRMFPGEWTVGSMQGNAPANRFWQSVVAGCTAGDFGTSHGKDEPWGIDMVYHHFTSSR